MISWVAYLSIGLVIGIGVGVYASRLDMFRSKKQLELEQQLHDTREELAGYRKNVAEHFIRTSTLVNSMTESYRAVFDHLADGARNLCGDEVKTLQLDLPEKHLIGEADNSEPPAVQETAAGDSGHEQTAQAQDGQQQPMDETPQGPATRQSGEEARFAETPADDDSHIPNVSAANSEPGAQQAVAREAQESDDEHAAYVGEQNAPPASTEEKTPEDSTRIVH